MVMRKYPLFKISIVNCVIGVLCLILLIISGFLIGFAENLEEYAILTSCIIFFLIWYNYLLNASFYRAILGQRFIVKNFISFGNTNILINDLLDKSEQNIELSNTTDIIINISAIYKVYYSLFFFKFFFKNGVSTISFIYAKNKSVKEFIIVNKADRDHLINIAQTWKENGIPVLIKFN
jgi:hypothetical protein